MAKKMGMGSSGKIGKSGGFGKRPGAVMASPQKSPMTKGGKY